MLGVVRFPVLDGVISDSLESNATSKSVISRKAEIRGEMIKIKMAETDKKSFQ